MKNREMMEWWLKGRSFCLPGSHMARRIPVHRPCSIRTDSKTSPLGWAPRLRERGGELLARPEQEPQGSSCRQSPTDNKLSRRMLVNFFKRSELLVQALNLEEKLRLDSTLIAQRSIYQMLCKGLIRLPRKVLSCRIDTTTSGHSWFTLASMPLHTSVCRKHSSSLVLIKTLSLQSRRWPGLRGRLLSRRNNSRYSWIKV